MCLASRNGVEKLAVSGGSLFMCKNWQEVDEFTLDIPALENIVQNSETGVGTTAVTPWKTTLSRAAGQGSR
jgi:hypothetical protein